ncbi:MAG TPA: hypothetical protein VLL27_10070 [Solirubrobacterales bacterium]|nr:hypothetical protein [Solirubrobacterales bacterium]
MADLPQADFCRLARGGTLAPPGGLPAEKVVLGISSASHAAIRRVHNETPEIALSNLTGTLRKYFLSGGPAAETARRYHDCVETYIDWDEAASPATETPHKGAHIAYGEHIVRSRPDVILGDDGTGEYEVRVLLWDELGLNQAAAEVIALPALDRVEETYGAGKVAIVKVLHLPTRHLEEVAEDAARARRPDVEALLDGV